jgi:hypothetical protein
MQLWRRNAANTWQARPLVGTHYLTQQDGSLRCQPRASRWHALLYPWQDIHHPATYLLLVSPAANIRDARVHGFSSTSAASVPGVSTHSLMVWAQVSAAADTCCSAAIIARQGLDI